MAEEQQQNWWNDLSEHDAKVRVEEFLTSLHQQEKLAQEIKDGAAADKSNALKQEELAQEIKDGAAADKSNALNKIDRAIFKAKLDIEAYVDLCNGLTEFWEQVQKERAEYRLFSAVSYSFRIPDVVFSRNYPLFDEGQGLSSGYAIVRFYLFLRCIEKENDLRGDKRLANILHYADSVFDLVDDRASYAVSRAQDQVSRLFLHEQLFLLEKRVNLEVTQKETERIKALALQTEKSLNELTKRIDNYKALQNFNELAYSFSRHAEQLRFERDGDLWKSKMLDREQTPPAQADISSENNQDICAKVSFLIKSWWKKISIRRGVVGTLQSLQWAIGITAAIIVVCNLGVFASEEIRLQKIAQAQTIAQPQKGGGVPNSLASYAWQNHLPVSLPLIGLEFVLFYFFRIYRRQEQELSAQILQLETRRNFLQFIQGYAEFKKSQAPDHASFDLDKFETAIFSNVMVSPQDIPAVTDGMEQLAHLINAVKNK